MQAEELILKPFQVPVIDAVRDARAQYKNVLLQAPTGFGKTTCFAYMVGRSYQRGYSVWITTHLIELLEQVAERFERYGIPFSYIASGYPSGDEIIKLCSIDTLKIKQESYRPPHWGVDDECHLVAANRYQKVREYTPATRWLGTSGTPLRLDGKSLGDSYDFMVQGPQRRELQAVGQLVPAVCYYPQTDLDLSSCRKTADGELNLIDQAAAMARHGKIVGCAIEHYQRICAGVQFVVFAPTLDFCAEVAQQFTAAGIPTSVISSKLTRHERRAIFTGYKNGSIKGLVNVNLVTSGVDVPGCGCIIWLRKTASQVIWDQGNGRAMRGNVEGKTCCYIIDHVGNSYDFGSAETGFMPDCDRFYSLAPVEKKKKKKAEVSALKRCEVCYAMWETGGSICTICGATQTVKEREIVTVDGQLILLTDDARQQELMLREAKKRKLIIGMGRCRKKSDFVLLAYEMGFPNPLGWAEAQWIRRNNRQQKAIKI